VRRAQDLRQIRGKKMRQLTTLLILISYQLFGQRTLDYNVSQRCQMQIHFYDTDSVQRIEIINHKTGERIKTLITDEVSYFEKPVIFSFDQEKFIRINEVVKGTGYFITDHIFNIRENCLLTDVEVIEESQVHRKNLPDSIRIFKGEYRTYSDNRITFQYALWKKDDSNCCPSLGYILGTYKIVKQNTNGQYKYKMCLAEKRHSYDPN